MMNGYDDCLKIIMSKRPFNKIRRIQRNQNLAQTPLQDQTTHQRHDSREGQSRAPKLSIDKKKKIKIINDQALRKNQDNQPESKTSLGSKPNLFKGKREGGKLIIKSNRNTEQEMDRVEQSHGDPPKPTPTIGIKKRFNIGGKRPERQQVVIEEESQPFNTQPNEDEAEVSASLARKPDMKVRRMEKREGDDDSHNFDASYREQERSKDIFNPPVNIEYRAINVEPNTASLSEGRIDKQNKRTRELKKLLNLQNLVFQHTFSQNSITPYEIVFNKIKGGYLVHSADQAFDQKTHNSCQTLPLEFSDFKNQCPQDYSQDLDDISTDDMFETFILGVAPIIEELIKPTQAVTSPPIFLLAFRPEFKSFHKCPYPMFVYHSDEYKLDLIVMGEKLYITEGEITSVVSIGSSLVAGLSDGSLVLWNGRNNKGSRLYQQIKEITQSTNFELPSFTTHQMERYSSYATDRAIIDLIIEERGRFCSLDAAGKMVTWQIQEAVGNIEILKPVRGIELAIITQHPSIQAYFMRRRSINCYVSTSIGVICLHNDQIRQRLDSGGHKIVHFQVPALSPLLYAVTEGNKLLVFNEFYSHSLFEMNLSLGRAEARQIIIPQIEHDNRQIFFLFVAYVVDSQGQCHQVKLLQNKVQAVHQIGGSGEESDDRKVIYRGVSRVGQSLQTVQLMCDLKMKSSLNRMRISGQKSIANLKSIIQKNRELMTELQSENTMIA